MLNLFLKVPDPSFWTLLSAQTPGKSVFPKKNQCCLHPKTRVGPFQLFNYLSELYRLKVTFHLTADCIAAYASRCLFGANQPLRTTRKARYQASCDYLLQDNVNQDLLGQDFHLLGSASFAWRTSTK